MKKYLPQAALCAAALAFSATATAGDWSHMQLKISASCANYGTLTGPATGAGSTNGIFGTYLPGDTFTFTATGNGSGSWRIVGDPAGTTTYAAGGTFPGTLSFRVPSSITATGMGYYVDAHSGTADTVSGTCVSTPPNGIPTLSEYGLMLLGMMVGLFGAAGVMRRRAR